MIFGPDCSGECKECVNFYAGRCLAGHGDDNFIQITYEKAKEIMKKPHVTEKDKELLKIKYADKIMEKWNNDTRI
jgi:hypothetical protein